MKTITMKDVAREAQVSLATVSRAFNGGDNVTEATRDRIMGIARKLRFIPHSGARSLITRRTETIGVLLPDLFGEFFSEIIRGIDHAARERKLHLLVSSSHGDSVEAAAAIRAMRGRVDGLLIMSPHVSTSFLAENLPDDLPIVLMNTHVEGEGYSSLNVDNYGGAYAMLRHLFERGHHQIALISGGENNFDAQERLRGYRDAMAALLPGSKEIVVRGDFSEESGYRAGQQLLALKTRPSAIFASNDMMAIGCLFALNEAGIKVPGDIALAGYDDIPIARFITPPLTTVRVRIAELGSLALERLVLAIENPDRVSTSPQTLRCELVIRNSCSREQSSIEAVSSSRAG